MDLPRLLSGSVLHDAGRIALAWGLCGLIGWQRETQGRAAGLRTHMLVGGAACLLSLISTGQHDGERLAAQVITGIGFLGAGVILRRGLSVRGLTTAATVWMAAAIGIAVGAGDRYAVLATFITLLTLLTLTIVKRVEAFLRQHGTEATVLITVARRKGQVTEVMEAITRHGASILDFDQDDTDEADKDHRTLRLHLRLHPRRITRDTVGAAIAEAAPQAHVEWE